MVFIDGSALTGLIQPIRGTAFAGTATYDVAPVYPGLNVKVPVPHPSLRVMVACAGSTSYSVQYQVSTSATFVSTTFDSTAALVPNGEHLMLVSPATLVAGTTYYWRARAGDGAGTWGPWRGSTAFTYDPNAGRGYGTVYENVGSAMVREDVAIGQVYENVGFVVDTAERDTQYFYLNVGPEQMVHGSAWDSLYLGNVTTDTPTPHIWFLRPTAGRAGDGIQIVCFGVGALQATYGGSVEVYYGPLIGWEAVPVINWQTYPETANAYLAARKIDASTNELDPQHSVIEITVPADAIPPGYPVRIRTDGP